MSTDPSLYRIAVGCLRSWAARNQSARDTLIEIPLQHRGTAEEVEAALRIDSTSQHVQLLQFEAHALSCWRHPNARMAVAIVLTVLNFIMFLEDPCSFAKTEAELSIVGNLINFVFGPWPSELELCVIKIGLLLIGLPLGFLLGRFVLHHKILRDTLKLPMFGDLNGTVLTEIIGMVSIGYFVAWAWRELLSFYGREYVERFAARSGLGITDETFAYRVQIACAFADVFTIVMLLDVMLQDTSQHAGWCLRLRILWTRNCIRLGSTWIAIPLLFLVQVFLIGQSYSWDVEVLQSERSRGLVAALIFMLDVITVCQDWEFPFFDNPLEINLVGTTSPDLDLGCAECQCSGKWLNYGPMVLVMLLDLNNLSNQWRYGFFDPPTYYGQYLDAHGWIWAVTNKSIAGSLRECYLAAPEAYRPSSNRGSCVHAVPCSLVTSEMVARDPPCFAGDRRLTGTVQQLDRFDFVLPAIPVLIALVIFAGTAYRLPRMPSEQKRRESALSLLTAQKMAERMNSTSGPELPNVSMPLRVEPDREARLLRIAPVAVEWPSESSSRIEFPDFCLMDDGQ